MIDLGAESLMGGHDALIQDADAEMGPFKTQGVKGEFVD